MITNTKCTVRIAEIYVLNVNVLRVTMTKQTTKDNICLSCGFKKDGRCQTCKFIPKIKLIFRWANGEGWGKGRSVFDCARHLRTNNKKIETGELIQIIDEQKHKVYYWDSREFHKALDVWVTK